MADEVQYSPAWKDEGTQCKNCRAYQEKEAKHACVPDGKTFEEAIAAYGEISPDGHCNYFQAK